MSNPVRPHSLFTDLDIYLFKQGKHFRLWEKLGSHPMTLDGIAGTHFAVWAPNAREVVVAGDFNNFDLKTHFLQPRADGSGIWEGFIEGVKKGNFYKYNLLTPAGFRLDKGDPFALAWEVPPRTASVVWEFTHDWKDGDFMQKRTENAAKPRPFSAYEVHIGSWRKKSGLAKESLNYAEMADELVNYCVEMGFTHLELMPVMEHPYYASWGYQVTGFFAPTSRFGTPDELMYLIDKCHRAGLGVLLDWVPSHFPGDIHGLYLFDGTHLFEYADPKEGFHQDWNSYIFNYSRFEVRSFLISNALFWLEKYHADGLRVDAVASMLYRDYSRKEGQWIPNQYGGRENLEAISLFKELNEQIYKLHPGVETIAEESTAFPKVSKPTYDGGLGFGQKWMMGWMHDALKYFEKPMHFRRWHQNDITFSFDYVFSERFMLPLSHDEVVHLKGSLLTKMSGNEWEKFANLRALFGLMWVHPGHQLLFMGGEIGQIAEWSHDRGVDWELLEKPLHAGIQNWIKALNKMYTSRPALYKKAFEPAGFEWVSGGDTENSVLIFLRKGEETDKPLLIICHFNIGTIENYSAGVPIAGKWTEILNSDSTDFGGSGITNGTISTEKGELHHHPQRISFKLAPLAVQVFESEKGFLKEKKGKK
jgi:1,4-alpha-glucan branching enzyme